MTATRDQSHDEQIWVNAPDIDDARAKALEHLSDTNRDPYDNPYGVYDDARAAAQALPDDNDQRPPGQRLWLYEVKLSITGRHTWKSV